MIEQLGPHQLQWIKEKYGFFIKPVIRIKQTGEKNDDNQGSHTLRANDDLSAFGNWLSY